MKNGLAREISPFGTSEVFYRKIIQDIDDSYSHEWDILAELLQNAVDAIKQRKAIEESFDPLISIEIDCDSRSIKISDNGKGMTSDEAAMFLPLFSSGKAGDSDTVGEKGVGLKFAMFSTDSFSLESSQNGKVGPRASMQEGYSWKTKARDELPKIKISEEISRSRGTSISLAGIPESPIFDWSDEQLVFILRTKTAIGDVKGLFLEKSPGPFKVSLSVIRDGDKTAPEVLPRFMLPFDYVKREHLVSIEEFNNFAQDAGRTDEAKRRKIRSKIIFKQEQLEDGASAVAYFVPSRDYWDRASREAGLSPADVKESDEEETLRFQPGIFVSVKGMPTGVSVKEPPRSGNAGYWQNVFILIDFPKLKFDIGRKSLTGRQVEKVNNYSRKVFAEFTKIFVKWGIDGSRVPMEGWLDSKDTLAMIAAMPDLNVVSGERMLMVKDPSGQEASVAAIFYQLLGEGKLPGIVPVTSGYKNQYDLFATVNGSAAPRVFEFKSKLRNLAPDFEMLTKEIAHLDAVVCWDVDSEDLAAMSSINAEVFDLRDEAENSFPGATHQLHVTGIKPVTIIDLKALIERQG